MKRGKTPAGQLAEFLLEVYQPSELESLLRAYDYVTVANAVSPRSAPASYVFEVVRALQRMGELDEEFFELLVSKFPKRRPRIMELAALFHVTLGIEQAEHVEAVSSAAADATRQLLHAPAPQHTSGSHAPPPEPPTGVSPPDRAEPPPDVSPADPPPQQLNLATAFLCHASSDKPLVRDVARELGRRGVIPWLDELRLGAGDTISSTLAEAVRASTLLVVFLSRDAVASEWVKDEIKALTQLSREDARQRLVLISPAAPRDLSVVPPQLRSLVLHPDRDELDVNMVLASNENAATIAGKLAATVYKRMDTASQQDVNVVLDQRGAGHRVGPPVELGRLNLARPTLVFRHDYTARRPHELLHGDDWTHYQRDVRSALDAALPQRHGRTVHIAGYGQAALGAMLGWHLPTSSGVALHAHGRQGGQVLSNAAAIAEAVPAGRPDCNTVHPVYAPDLTRDPLEIDLIVAPQGRMPAITAYRQAAASPPAVWVQPGPLDSSEQVMNLRADLIALLRRLGSPASRLFIELPFHMIVMVASGLDGVARRLRIMEYDRDRADRHDDAGQWYAELALPLEVGGADNGGKRARSEPSS